MKSKLRIITLLLSFIMFSCIESNNKENQDSSSIPADKNFPMIECNEIMFKKNVKGINEDGATLVLSLTFMNNTNDKITDFTLSYYMKAEYKDGTIEYFPQNIFEKFEDDDINRFNKNSTPEWTLGDGEVWLPESTKTLNLLIFASYGFQWGSKISIRNDVFNRTPSELFIALKYKAISVDNEYENIITYDILDHWINYQSEIGLR